MPHGSFYTRASTALTISLCLKIPENGPRVAFLTRIMGFTRPIDDAILQFEADEPRTSGSSRLFVMPARPADWRQEKTPIPFQRRRGNLLLMPKPGTLSRPIGRSNIQFHGNAIEYWPRGYPAHDDL